MIISDRFTGTSVLLTGAGSGIGRATALRLVAQVADVADEAAVVATVDAAVAGPGRLDVLVNVAGIHRTTPIERLTVGDLRALVEVNVLGTALFRGEALKHLPEGGVVVNTASTPAGHGNPFMTAYSASKSAVLAFSLSLASEVIGRGVRVVVVSPGTIATPLTAGVRLEGLDAGCYARIVSPMGPGRPEQVAATIAFAASRAASYVAGVELRADGGSHSWPPWGGNGRPRPTGQRSA